VGEEQMQTSRRGLADARLKVSMILAGSRAMMPATRIAARRDRPGDMTPLSRVSPT
jgi:hypothetical protein